MVSRLSQYDLPARLVGLPRWLTEVLVAVLLTGVATVLRFGIDLIADDVVPFALLYPAILIATLIAGWRSGALVLLLGGAMTLYFVLPPDRSFRIERFADLISMALYTLSASLVLAVADSFRRAALLVAAERAQKLSERELVLRELNHRIKNSFASMHGLLSLQSRNSSDPGVQAELQAAADRVRSFSEAYADLYSEGDEVGSIDMQAYLERLCRSLRASLMLDGLTELRLAAEPAQFSRDRAVALGLIVNELVTNAAKYAFADRGTGLIEVRFAQAGEGWLLTVRDNGVGLPADYPGPSAGIGHTLIAAFARQAGGALAHRSGDGAVFEIRLPPD